MSDQLSFGSCINEGLRRGLVAAVTREELELRSTPDKDGLLSSDHICVAIAQAMSRAGYTQIG